MIEPSLLRVPAQSDRVNFPWTRLALVAWLVLAIALMVKLVCWPNRHTVFPVYHAAVQAWLAGESPYERVGELDLFRYPPPSIWLFAPFGLLDLRLGGALWGLASVGITLWGLISLLNYALPGAKAWSDRQTAVFLGASLAIASRGLWNAQANGMLGGLIFLSVAGLARSKTLASAVAMAAALLLKPTMISIPMLVAAWRPTWGLKLLGGLAALMVLAAVPQPKHSLWLWEKWVEHGKSSSGERRGAFRDAWTLGLTIADLVRPGGNEPGLETAYARWYYPAVPGACAFMALGTGWWLTRKMDNQAAVCLMAALGTCWMMLFGPAIEHPTYLLAAPWLAWCLVSHQEGGSYSYLGWLAGLAGSVLIFFAGGLQANSFFPPLSASMPIAMLLLTGWLVAWGLGRQNQTA